MSASPHSRWSSDCPSTPARCSGSQAAQPRERRALPTGARASREARGSQGPTRRGLALRHSSGRPASPGWSHPCWGYPFDWETRYGPIPANTPTIVATGIVTNALAVADDVFGPRARANSSSARRVRALGIRTAWRAQMGRSAGRTRRTIARPCSTPRSRGRGSLPRRTPAARRPEVLEPAAQSARFVMSHQQDSAPGRTRSGTLVRGQTTSTPATSSSAFSSTGGSAAIGEWGKRSTGDGATTGSGSSRRHDAEVLRRPAGPVDATACAQAIITLSRSTTRERRATGR